LDRFNSEAEYLFLSPIYIRMFVYYGGYNNNNLYPAKPGPGKPAIRMGEVSIFFPCTTFVKGLNLVFPFVGIPSSISI
jgi:hypothetical protein